MLRVAVVIPVHNGEPFLVETLAAVAAQTRPCDELVVVDDGSTDGAVESARASGIGFKVVPLRQGGVSRARNQGLVATSSELVCFLDQDDVWHPEHLCRQVALFERDPGLGAVVSPYHHWHPRVTDGAYVRPSGLPENPQGATDPRYTGWVYHEFLRDCWALTSATMVRRDVLDRLGGFDESLPFSEDWDLWLRLSREVRFAALQGPPVLYRQHAVQGSRRVRGIDYRCRLLLAAAQNHGLASRDGRRIRRRDFNACIARYEAEFGYDHLRFGDRRVGLAALWRAWRRRPVALKPLAYAMAAWLGWRPGGAPASTLGG